MKKIFLFTLVFLTVSVTAHAMTVSHEWEKIYRMGWIDYPLSIQQTTDGGYILAGFSSFSHSTAACVLKLDINGNVSWLKTYDLFSWASSIQQTTDGGYIVVADGIGLFKLDSNGDISWNKIYQGGEFPDLLIGSHHYIRQTTDGGYIVAGNFGPNLWWQGDQDFWVIKFDSIGNIIWQNTYGGSGEEAPSIAEETLFVQQTTDGGYIVTGPTESFGAGSADFWVLKLDSSGNVSWQKTYGGIYYDQPYSIQQTVDGGYIIAGTNGGLGALIIKLDQNGNVTWQKAYATETTGLRATSIQQISDGGYILAGSIIGEDMELFVMRVDSNGTPSWLKIFQEHLSGYVPRIEKTQDGGYIVSASAKNDQGWDFWILKLNSEGTISGCDAIVDAEAVLIDYSISTQDTEAIIHSPAITLYDLSCEAVSQTSEISAICQYNNLSDLDGDGVENALGGTMASNVFLAGEDNCPDMPNGSYLGTCTAGESYKIGRPCINDVECGTDGFCSMNQEDSNGNGIGDACYLCEADFDCDGDCDGTDAGTFKFDFGRSSFNNPCNNDSQCHGDFDCDNDCDGTDAANFKVDFGRSEFNNPCPTCTAGDWCNYP